MSEILVDDEGNPIPAGGGPKKPALTLPETLVDPEGNPLATAPVKAAASMPPAPPPGMLSLLGNFLGGTPGGTGGLKEQLPSPSGLIHMFTSPFETARGIAKKSVDRFSDSQAKGYSLPLSLATGIPLIGPAAAEAGEAIGTGDSRKMASGLGSATGLLAPFALPKAIGAAAKVTGAEEAAAAQLSKGVVKSYARALNAPTAKLAKVALDVAPTLASEDLTAMNSTSLARKIASKTNEAGQAVDAAIAKYKDVPINKAEILKRIDSAKNPHINPITGEPRSEISLKAVQAIEDLKNQTDKNLGPNPTVQQLVDEKRALDKEIVGNKAAWADASRTGRVPYQKDVANILRDTLNDVHPEIAKANENFSEWAKAKLVSRASEAKKAAGDVMGTGGSTPGIPTSGLASFAMKAANMLRLKNNSAAWNTLMGSQKQAILDALKAGEMTPAAEDALQAGLVTAQAKAKKPSYFPDLKKAQANAAEAKLGGAPPPVPPILGVLTQ